GAVWCRTSLQLASEYGCPLMAVPCWALSITVQTPADVPGQPLINHASSLPCRQQWTVGYHLGFTLALFLGQVFCQLQPGQLAAPWQKGDPGSSPGHWDSHPPISSTEIDLRPQFCRDRSDICLYTRGLPVSSAKGSVPLDTLLLQLNIMGHEKEPPRRAHGSAPEHRGPDLRQPCQRIGHLLSQLGKKPKLFIRLHAAVCMYFTHSKRRHLQPTACRFDVAEAEVVCEIATSKRGAGEFFNVIKKTFCSSRRDYMLTDRIPELTAGWLPTPKEPTGAHMLRKVVKAAELCEERKLVSSADSICSSIYQITVGVIGYLVREKIRMHRRSGHTVGRLSEVEAPKKQNQAWEVQTFPPCFRSHKFSVGWGDAIPVILSHSPPVSSHQGVAAVRGKSWDGGGGCK
ncbi:hypothetical protein KUCAC02_030497, partial [Chaenocephalus aceratus]